VSACLIAVAALTKYYAISLIPLLLVDTVVRRRRADARLVLLLIPVLLLACYQWLTLRLYTIGLLTDAARFANEYRDQLRPQLWLNNILSFADLLPH
jgi:hypothetical protein